MEIVKEIKAEETYALRLEVLRNGINLPYEFEGDLDEDTFHLGVFKENEILGIATFMKRKSDLFSSENQYQLRGMATLKKGRGLGYGNELLKKGLSILKKKNINTLWCNARKIAFYIKNGFKVVSKPFNINQIGIHYTLTKQLK